MNYNLCMIPVEMGGTWLLDYDEELHGEMEEVIIACNREDLVLCSKSASTFDDPKRCSLHLIGDNFNLNDFWEACLQIKLKD